MVQTIEDSKPAIAPFRTWRAIAGLAFLALIYWFAVRFGIWLTAEPEGVASIWPASGLALGVLLLRPKREWPTLLAVIFVTNFMGNWSGGNTLVVSLGFALANTLEPALCAWMMIYLCKSKITFERTVEIFTLLVVAIFANGLTSLIGAVVPTLVFGTSFLNAFRVWWVADGLGIMLVTPLIVTWINSSSIERFKTLRKPAETILLILALTLFAWMAFGPFNIAEIPLLRTYLFFPFLLWLAFRFAPRGMTHALFVVAVIAIGGTLRGTGMFALHILNQTDRLVALQMFLSVLTFSGLLISAMVAERKMDTEKLQMAEANYRSIFENAPVGFFQSSSSGRFLNVNPMTAQIYGFESPAEMLIHITDIATQIYTSTTDWDEFQRQMIEHGQVFEFVRQNQRKDGNLIWITTNARAVKDANGKLLYYEGFLKDITGIKQAEGQIRQSEITYRGILDSLAEAIYIQDESGVFIDVNQGAERMYGYSRQELIGKSPSVISADGYNDLSRLMPMVNRAYNGTPEVFEFWGKRKNGEIFPKEVHLYPGMYFDRPVVIAIAQDISERKQSEEDLRASEERYRRLIEAITDYIYTVQVKDGWALETSHGPGCLSVTGYTPEEFAAEPYLWHRMIWPDDHGNVQNQVRNLLTGHDVEPLEHRIIRKDGQIRWIRNTLSPHFDKRQQLISYDGLIQDITERKQAEAALQKFAFMANTAPEFMSLINRRHIYESVNDAYCRARSKPRTDFIGHSLTEVWGETLYRGRLTPYLDRCFAGEIVRYEEIFAFSETGLRTYQVGMYPYRPASDDQVTHVVVVTSDITEFKQTETALRLSESNLNKAQHFAHLGSWTWNIKTNHLDWSDEMYNIFDVDRKTFTGSLPDVISQAIHPDDRAKVDASNMLVTTEGRPIPLDYRIVRRDGSVRVVWAEAGELVRDEMGQPIFLSGTVQDITERKQMEEDLRASLAEKETLLKEVHHRVKNNLQIISSLLSMQASISQNELVTHALDESKNRVRAMALIHEKLYQSKNLEYIQAEEYISELMDHLLSSFAGQMHNISIDLQVANLTLDINKAIPCGMIINELVSNALKYAFIGQENGLLKICLDAQDGKINLVISDNGVGLPVTVDVYHPETLGLELVSILSHQLKASMKLIRQAGTTFAISFDA